MPTPAAWLDNERMEAANAERAVQLAAIADECMRTGRLPMTWDTDPEMLGLRAETWTHENPVEVRFTAEWPGITLVCSRSLAGYSLDGGLHRVTP